jgi:hypothetical protein
MCGHMGRQAFPSVLLFRPAKNTCALSPLPTPPGCYKLLMQFAMDNIRARVDNPAGNFSGPFTGFLCGPDAVFPDWTGG